MENAKTNINTEARALPAVNLAPIRKGLVFAAIYELFAVLLLLGLPYLQVQVLELDILYPLFSMNKIPLFNTLGYIVLALIIVQIMYAIILPKFYIQSGRDDGTGNNLSSLGKILGTVIGIIMLFIIPTGTFFGALLLMQIFSKDKNSAAGVNGANEENDESVENKENDESVENKENDESVENKENDGSIKNKENDGSIVSRENNVISRVSSMQKYILITTILMLHQPIILLIMQFWIITLPIDMAYPALSVKQTTAWEIVAWIILVIFLVQLIFSLLLPKLKENNPGLTKGLLKFFGLFMILSLGIFLQALILVIGIDLKLDTGVLIALCLTWIFGILLNPLGAYFGKEYMKFGRYL